MIEPLFNLITCEYPLPIPDSHREDLASVVWEEIVFLTGSLCFSDLHEYSITSSGQFYLEGNKSGPIIRKIDYTGELLLVSTIEKEDKDYELAFKVLFFKGNLKEVSCEKVRTLDNTERIEALRKNKSLLMESFKTGPRSKRFLKTSIIKFGSLIFSAAGSCFLSLGALFGYLYVLTLKIKKWLN